MKKKLTILVCAHKKDPYTRNKGIYKAIQVGKALHPELDLGYINDNDGDNISEKNPQWCELTALYWGWKNIKDTEYMGLCHYRRYFDCDIKEDTIEKLLKNKDILLLNRNVENCCIATRFMELVSMEDFYIFMDSLMQYHPDYRKAIIDYCYNSNLFYPCTMFVSRKEIYDDFCSTFFPVFEDVEKRLKTHGYSRLNRCIAYLGELSLGLYVTHNHLRRKFVKMDSCGIDEEQLTSFRSNIRNWKKRIGFKLMYGHINQLELGLYHAVKPGLKGDGIDLNYL